MENLSIGTRIAELRKGANLAQNELAEKLMISNKAVSKWESNNGSPSLEMLIKLSEVLNCSLDYLILGKSCDDIKLINEIPIIFGKDVSGTNYTKDLCKLVHCFIGGEVGAGKSILLHNIITQLISGYKQEDLQLALIDTKRVEFYKYGNVPHLYMPVANTVDETYELLLSLEELLEKRYDVLMRSECTKIQEYNQKNPSSKIPFIVVIIDELAELIINVKRNTEILIQRLTQLGRAAGIHVIAATHRIKECAIKESLYQNFQTRIAFKLKEPVEYCLTLKSPNNYEIRNVGEMLMFPQYALEPIKLKVFNLSMENIDNILRGKGISPCNL